MLLSQSASTNNRWKQASRQSHLLQLPALDTHPVSVLPVLLKNNLLTRSSNLELVFTPELHHFIKQYFLDTHIRRKRLFECDFGHQFVDQPLNHLFATWIWNCFSICSLIYIVHFHCTSRLLHAVFKLCNWKRLCYHDLLAFDLSCIRTACVLHTVCSTIRCN